MKYLFIVFLLLSGCAPTPGTFEAKVTKVWYKEFDPTNGIDVFSEKYGNITIYNSPYYHRAKSRDTVTVACTHTTGFFSPSDCAILDLKSEQK